MAAAPIITDLPIERPGESGSHFTEPWIEPFLVKHWRWYRQHLTKAGRRESKAASSRTASVTTTQTDDLKEASLDEEEQWRRVEEEFKATSAEHEKERRVLEV